MKYIRYKFSIDDDVMKTYDIRVPSQIGFYVMAYLNHPNGWSTHGYFFEPVKSGESVYIRLSSSQTIQQQCGNGKLSCAELGGSFMYLNSERWFHGSVESKLTLDDYRQYMVSHEIGHILGYDHVKCPCVGCKAPVMMQQTIGIGKCKPNTSVN